MIFVTGATGILGGNLIRSLIDDGKAVRALFRSEQSIKRNPCFKGIENAIDWVKGDVGDILSLREALVGVTKVYHCAGLISMHPGDNQKLIDVNIKGSRNIVDACLEKPDIRLVYVSSVAALARNSEREVIDEGSPWDGPDDKSSAYHKSKYLGECEVWRGIEEGLNAVIVNPSVILGLGPETQSSGIIFNRVWNGLKFYPPGSTGFVTAKDCVKAMKLLMNTDIKGQRFILNSRNILFKDIFGKMADYLDKKAPSFLPPRWMGELAWRIASLSALMGKSPEITKASIKAGYEETAFDGSRISEYTSFEYLPFDEELKSVCYDYKKVLSA